MYYLKDLSDSISFVFSSIKDNKHLVKNILYVEGGFVQLDLEIQ